MMAGREAEKADDRPVDPSDLRFDDIWWSGDQPPTTCGPLRSLVDGRLHFCVVPAAFWCFICYFFFVSGYVWQGLRIKILPDWSTGIVAWPSSFQPLFSKNAVSKGIRWARSLLGARAHAGGCASEEVQVRNQCPGRWPHERNILMDLMALQFSPKVLRLRYLPHSSDSWVWYSWGAEKQLADSKFQALFHSSWTVGPWLAVSAQAWRRHCSFILGSAEAPPGWWGCWGYLNDSIWAIELQFNDI